MFLALQGDFFEHQTKLQMLPFQRQIVVVLVRTVDDLALCDALIIPGGGAYITIADCGFIRLVLESTSIAILAESSGLLDPLREFTKKKPVWGTCAGAILLAQAVKGAKKGGQELLGSISITIERNGWGSQV
jgi:pyridoxal 5'-phosphate synthase pdxT subunit